MQRLWERFRADHRAFRPLTSGPTASSSALIDQPFLNSVAPLFCGRPFVLNSEYAGEFVVQMYLSRGERGKITQQPLLHNSPATQHKSKWTLSSLPWTPSSPPSTPSSAPPPSTRTSPLNSMAAAALQVAGVSLLKLTSHHHYHHIW